MKKLYDLKHDKNLTYDPNERRGNAEIDLNFCTKKSLSKKQRPLNIKFNKENEEPQKRVKKEEYIKEKSNPI